MAKTDSVSSPIDGVKLIDSGELCSSNGLCISGLLIVTSGLANALGLSNVTEGLWSCKSPNWLVSVVIGLVKEVTGPSGGLFHVDNGVCREGTEGGGGYCLPLE